jgi:hypothetical protein
MTRSRIFLALLVPVTVHGLFFKGTCSGAVCVDNLPTSCSELVAQHDFKGDDCCFAFLDAGEDGCDLIITGKNSDGPAFCSVKERTYDCHVSVEPALTYSCKVEGAAYTPVSGTPFCRDASYTSYNSSEHEIIAASTMTLSGISGMTYQQAMDWQALLGDHMNEYYESNRSNSTFFDVLSYFRVYVAENGNLVGDKFANELSVVFLQFLTWRSGQDTIAMDATAIRDNAFSNDGKLKLLSRLQQTKSFSSITDISDMTTLEPPYKIANTAPDATMLSSFTKGDTVAAKKDCYNIDRYMENTVYSNGCTTTFLKYSYFNGGKDTRTPKETYQVAEVDLLHSCDDTNAYPDTCAIAVADTNFRCQDCSYVNGKVTMGPGCSEALQGILQPNQTVGLFFDGVDSPDPEQFFSLVADDGRMCQHPAQEVSLLSSYQSQSSLTGKPELGHCYNVDRSMEDAFYSNDCVHVTLRYSYDIIGIDDSYNVEVNAVFACTESSGIEESCSIAVDGFEGICTNCYYEYFGKIVMLDCSNTFGDLFAPGNQTVQQPFDGADIPYEEQFFILGYTNYNCAAPTMPLPATAAVVAPTSAPTISFAASDTVVGNAEVGDCYRVDREIQESVNSNNGCTSTSLQFTYYNGGTDADGIFTGYPKEIYLILDIHVRHSCDDEKTYPNTCSMSVEGLDNTCDCFYDQGLVTLGDCPQLRNLFATGIQSLQLYFYEEDQYYDEEFFSLAYSEDHCSHPLVEVWLLSSVTSEDRVAGDLSKGDCYFVQRYMEDTLFSNGCTSVLMQYTYYTGGMNAEDTYTGYPQENYYNVYLDTLHSCNDPRIPSTCSITVDGVDGSCECSFAGGGFISMGTCTSLALDGIFAKGIRTVKQFFDGEASGYDQQFLALSYREDRCQHPSLISVNGPVYKFTTNVTAEPVVVSSFATGNIADGDPKRGDCYSVDRYMESTVYDDGCTRSYLWYTYFNGGMNSDFEDTGYDQVFYDDVEVIAWHSCDDQNAKPDICSVMVHSTNETCVDCFFIDNKIVVDCSGVLGEDMVAPGIQTVELFFDDIESDYDELFLSLAYDEEKCQHPGVVAALNRPSK